MRQPESLTHLDVSGDARMVDVGDKQVTVRRATASATVSMSTETARLVAAGNGPKGDVVSIARIAAIQAAKRTDELIPLAHPLPLDLVDVDVDIDEARGTVTVTCTTRTSARTGVEMEAMVGCATGALTVYDMVKGVERGVRISDVSLLAKSGGKRDWRREIDGES
ncbi:MAG: cyclic pyranopterin monophosphate synthase MoaC [Thermoleophilia bacterium]|nr:cyclic pyranopterin monophosphate synthase MoaC [Thermoleophilia bacterium]